MAFAKLKAKQIKDAQNGNNRGGGGRGAPSRSKPPDPIEEAFTVTPTVRRLFAPWGLFFGSFFKSSELSQLLKETTISAFEGAFTWVTGRPDKSTQGD